jgi:hypothetical protein
MFIGRSCGLSLRRGIFRCLACPMLTRKRRTGQGAYQKQVVIVGNDAVLLSILMPSNRNLADSRKAIETALAFCEKRDAKLVVSDNSRDPQKKRALRNISKRLVYLEPEADGLQANLMSVYDAADTEFILMMGDDDELFVSPKDTPIDLASLGADMLGVRPLIAVANSEGRIIRVKDFGIMDETPGGRVMAYNGRAKGDNAAYYSIFRRKPFIDLHSYFLTHHPLKGGYSDWALACVMFSYGKMVYDPGTIYKYNHHQWDRPEKIEAQRKVMFEAVGLAGSDERYGLLFLYLDMLILAGRPESPLSQDEKRNLLVEAGRPILGGFCKKMAAEPSAHSEEMAKAVAAMWSEPDAEAQFELALGATDMIQPGLAARYRDFRQRAMAF